MPALRAQFHLFDSLDERYEAFRLIFETPEEFFVRNAAIVSEQAINAREENSVGINEGIAIPKDLLELLDRTQGAPDARREPNEAHRTMFEALGEFEHVDE